MKFNYTYKLGIFKERINRFIAIVEIDDELQEVHVPNTGRLKELLIKNKKVMLSFHDLKSRKTKYELRFIDKDGVWVSVDSQLPNKIVREYLEEDRKTDIYGEYKNVKTEVAFLKSRFDIFLDTEKGMFIEVKGVNLELNGWGYFPDAPTSRGTKHLYELIEAMEKGYEASVIFLIQNPLINGFSPNKITDKKFSDALIEAHKKGVNIRALKCDINLKGASVIRELAIIL